MFKKYLNEMAFDTGYQDSKTSVHSGKKDFEWIKKYNPESLKLIVSKIGLKLYKTMNTFYLTDKNDKYLGKLQFKEKMPKKDKIQINSSHSNTKGFYQKIFSLILSFTNYKEIYSDISLSTNAINAYSKLDKASKTFEMYVLDKKDNKFIKFSKENLLKYPGNIVVITNNKKLIKEHILDFNERLKISPWNRMNENEFFDSVFGKLENIKESI